ncbi:hypothetical protein BN1012_Phect981 [Candidatus Phaeomarinobacter ectocarpi]|uniref:Uncharacterized protein n=1 Tax=Candidatus Phaeomarinibacter ectocarpi TaxID=1458461 RepID=X5ML63_9HYPH|nr:hypothetical protein BN1012_Phect981 [Candidatus Phaeomarinobacter ectocarpi]
MEDKHEVVDRGFIGRHVAIPRLLTKLLELAGSVPTMEHMSSFFCTAADLQNAGIDSAFLQ